MGAGFLFGNVPIIKDNFTLVTIGIVIVRFGRWCSRS